MNVNFKHMVESDKRAAKLEKRAVSKRASKNALGFELMAWERAVDRGAKRAQLETLGSGTRKYNASSSSVEDCGCAYPFHY